MKWPRAKLEVFFPILFGHLLPVLVHNGWPDHDRQQAAKLREVELALAEAQTQARRVSELEESLADLRAELDASRKDATDKAVEAGRLAGEGEALRAQVRELMDALKPQAKK